MEMRMKEQNLQLDCFLNSALANGRVCAEWRKNITTAMILNNLKTDLVSPIPAITLPRINHFLTKGCTKNKIKTHETQNICANKVCIFKTSYRCFST